MYCRRALSRQMTNKTTAAESSSHFSRLLSLVRSSMPELSAMEQTLHCAKLVEPHGAPIGELWAPILRMRAKLLKRPNMNVCARLARACGRIRSSQSKRVERGLVKCDGAGRQRRRQYN